MNKIPCCVCGTLILPTNVANQCSTCLASQFDLKELIVPSSTSSSSEDNNLIVVHQCRQCRRYARTPSCYEACDLESPQLLSICLKRIPAFVKGSSKLHIVDAIWVWTEPHSMRLKIRVTIRTELESIPLQQRVLLEYKVKFQQCPDCKKEYTNRTWHALVQLRQKRGNNSPRGGLATLEMALRKHKDVRKHVLSIDSCRHGLDFYFLTLSQAQHFCQFLQRLAPMKVKTSQKLVSTDSKNNTAHIKHTLTCDMVPLTRDDLVLVPKTLSKSSLCGRIGLVLKVSGKYIHIMDASPRRLVDTMADTMELSPEAYYKANGHHGSGSDSSTAGGALGYTILQTAERMIRFVVLDVELLSSSSSNNGRPLYQGPNSGIDKYAMADVTVARESDFGNNDTMYTCVTHLGNLIQPGDVVLGYDLVSTSGSLSTSGTNGFGTVVDLEDMVHSNVVLPDVVLVKKAKDSNKSGLMTNDDGNNKSNDLDEPPRNKKNKRISKKKLRRQQKQDKRQRELEESAERMGFYDDDDDVEEQQSLEQDLELQAELEQVERELTNYTIQEQEQREKTSDSTD